MKPTFDAYTELIEVIKFCKAADKFIENFDKNHKVLVEQYNLLNTRVHRLEETMLSIEQMMYKQKEQIDAITRKK